MLRKALTTTAIALLGLFTLSGVALAEPYEDDDTITVAITDADGVVDPDEVFVFLGEGFDADEGIGIEDVFTGPSGLRSTKALASAARSGSYTDQADGNGHFDIALNLGEVGNHTLTATGLSSGKVGSLTVVVVDGANTGGGTSSSTGGLAYTGAGGSGNSSDLAYTGSSLAGPIAIGAAAMLAGLALLFFGTRGVIRRRSAGSASGS